MTKAEEAGYKDVPYSIEYIGENGDFLWRTKYDMQYDLTKFTNASFTVHNGNGRAIAKCTDGMLVVYRGYKWDGCTIIGQVTETGPTLLASVPHDLLYIAKKAERKLPYTLSQADTYFRQLMETLYAGRGQHSVRPRLYYYGIKVLGWPFKFKKVPGYTVTIP